MGLTGGGFIALLFFLMAALVAFTVWWWPRGAGPTAGPAPAGAASDRSAPARATLVRLVLARLGLLVLTQAVALLAVLVAVNAHFEFYSGWDDLFALNAGSAKIKSVRARAGHGAPLAAALPVKRLGPRGPGHEPAKTGALEEYRFRGPETGLDADSYVLLPPQYFQPAYARRRFPVIVVLTGYPGHPSALLHVMHFPDLVRDGERTGHVPPAVYVLMRPTLAPPRDTECADVPGGPQVESFFADDVPLAVAAHYRVAAGRNGWGVMGDSTGGYCAVKFAMRHPGRYSAAASLSGYFGPIQDLTTGDLFGGNKALRDESDLMWREGHLPPPPVSLLIASCRVGEKTYPQARRFLAGVRAPLQADSLFLDSGGHNFRTFRRMVPASLQWFGAHLKAE
ncbi:alpha/beta hydrolase [Actinomadura roseirufa]|uniref:alpha/beta hydrolase n=1 Tax=Actinomadura roseirufa TaxID=2094049 RepID=UPI00104161C4|nr:alpha/beta hydrolase-fold protein [Actinomadura roseirufa]